MSYSQKLSPFCFLILGLKVAKESVKEQVFDVGHLAAVKLRLKALLTSELTPVSDMSHASAPKDKTIDEEGLLLRSF
jgi:hypothetical protein